MRSLPEIYDHLGLKPKNASRDVTYLVSSTAGLGLRKAKDFPKKAFSNCRGERMRYVVTKEVWTKAWLRLSKSVARARAARAKR